MQKQIHSSGKRSFFSKRSVGPQVREKFTFEDMMCFQRVMIASFHDIFIVSTQQKELTDVFVIGPYTNIIA